MGTIEYSVGLVNCTMTFSSIMFGVFAIMALIGVAAFILWKIFGPNDFDPMDNYDDE